jgi:PAS domain S-box-containing protein
LEKIGFEDFKQQLWETAKSLATLLQNHFYKENNVLYPAAMSVITEQEWIDVRKEFDEIGYCCFTPPELVTPAKSKETPTPTAVAIADTLQLATGNLANEQLDALLNTLPIEITFIDAEDNVRYFNKSKQMIFVRTKAVLGRKVQKCHPEKSLSTVIRIVESLKMGKKDVAEFWINLNARLIYIRFFAVRNTKGEYLGAVEVVQDVTAIKKLEGERRLLNWED